MKKYLQNTVFFSVGLIILNITAYFTVSRPILFDEYLVPRDSLSNYHSFLFADSHGAAIERDYLAKHGIFNFSFGSDSYCDIYNKVSFLYTTDVPVDTILISVDDHTLSLYRERINNLNRSILYASQQTFTQYSRQGVVSFHLHKYILPYLPLFNTSNARLFSYYLLSKLLPAKNATNNNKSPSGDGYGIDLNDSEDRMKYQFPGDEKSYQLENCLASTIQLCQRQGTVLIGVKFPLSGKYLSVLKDRSYHADQLLSQQGLTVIDLKYAFSGNDNLFKDPDHVNQQGGKEFSSKLIRHLKGE